MDPHPPAIFTIPGMRVGCLPYDAMMSSTLECFFSASCLNATAPFISHLLPNEWPMALDESTLTTLRSNTRMDTIISQWMVDRWEYATDFSGYYAACAPIECIYASTSTRFDNKIYLATLLISLYGGLTVILRIVIPFLVKCARSLHRRCKARKRSPVHPRQGLCRSLFCDRHYCTLDRSSFRVRRCHSSHHSRGQSDR